jgi:carboxyl-terminal processing protease
LKLIFSILITVAGFFLGMSLAGVGGISASTIFKAKAEGPKKLEKYWRESGIGADDVAGLISNDRCASSARYRNACISAVIQNGSFAEKHPDLTEKELMQKFLGGQPITDFESEVTALITKEGMRRQPVVAAGIVNAFLSVYYDPHTYIMPTGFFKDVSSKIERSKFFVGISYERKEGEFFIRKVSKNSDAELAGLKAEDRVLAINGKNLRGMDYEDISAILKDEDSETLEFKVVRKGSPLKISLVRSYRQLSHVQYNLLKAEKNFALITLSKFNKGTCREIAASLKTAEQDHAAGVVLDLRDNPGGFLDEAACIAGLFLGKNKKAYYVEYIDAEKSNEVILTSEDLAYRGPLAVLVNAASASAAESFAGAMQDYKRGVVIGQQTFGKGTFQEPEEWFLNEKISLFKTQGFYLLPSRNSTQVTGVRPDIEMPGTGTVKREGETFFNPVYKKGPKYREMRSQDLVKNFEYTNCAKPPAMNLPDDSVLQKSVEILGCAKETSLSLAQSSETVLN